MKSHLHIMASLAALVIGAGALPCAAQRRDANRPPQHQQPAPHQQPRPQARQESRPPQNPRPNVSGSANRPNRPAVTNRGSTQSPAFNPNRPPSGNRPANSNRPPSANTPPPRSFNSLNQQEKQRTLENNKDFQRRTPAEKQRLKEGLENWNRLSADQKNHIKNDVMPKWRQLPPDRQRAIGSRLNVLKNMPESARNQHLSDPNFTRGLSEEDKSMLHDLAHLHVGGSPEPPNNEP